MSTDTTAAAYELAAKLIENEKARRAAVRVGDRTKHNRLANENRELIGGARPSVLRSLTTIWMLELVELDPAAYVEQDSERARIER